MTLHHQDNVQKVNAYSSSQQLSAWLDRTSIVVSRKTKMFFSHFVVTDTTDTCLTATGTHVPYGITAKVTFPPSPQPKSGTRFSDHRGMQGWVDLVGLVTYQGGIPDRRRSPIPLLTGLNVEQLRSYDEPRFRYAKPPIKPISPQVVRWSTWFRSVIDSRWWTATFSCKAAAELSPWRDAQVRAVACLGKRVFSHFSLDMTGSKRSHDGTGSCLRCRPLVTCFNNG